MSADPPVIGACAGFGVRSTLDLRLLRSGGGLPLDVGELEAADLPVVAGSPVAIWEPSAENPFHGRLHETADGYAFWASDAGWFRIDPAGSTVDLPAEAAPLRREVRLWGIPAALCLLAHGSLSIHAACVEIAGRAILLAAPGRHGKTTLAAALHRAGHRVLAEDTTAVRVDEVASALPGPALFRLRQDIPGHVDPGDAIVLATDEERRHVTLPVERRGTGDPVPIAAIALLRTDDGPPAAVSRDAAEALRDVWALTFKLPTDESRALAFGRLAILATRVPIVDLRRPLRIDALPATIAAIEELAGQSRPAG